MYCVSLSYRYHRSVITSYEARLKMNSRITIDLPPEFISMCEHDGTSPEDVIRGFVADLAGIDDYIDHPRDDGYTSHGSDECMLARAYYDRVGYPYIG